MGLEDQDISTQAAYLRIRLWLGMTTRGQIVAWADQLIVDLDDPPVELMDVSIAQGQETMNQRLYTLAGSRDLTPVFKHVLAEVVEGLRSGHLDFVSIIQGGYSYACHQIEFESDPELAFELFSGWHSYVEMFTEHRDHARLDETRESFLEWVDRWITGD